MTNKLLRVGSYCWKTVSGDTTMVLVNAVVALVALARSVEYLRSKRII